MITEIIPNLYIGTIHDAIHDKTPWALVICVAEWNNFSDEERTDLMIQGRPIAHVPFMDYSHWSDLHQDCWVNLGKLNLISTLIMVGLNKGKVLVHCAAGVERAPLAVIHYLVRNNTTYDYDDAFAFVKAKRPIIENRLEWLRHG